MDAVNLAEQMMAQCVDEGQSARTVPSDVDAAQLLRALRETARALQIGIRTARMDEAVVVVRTDAELWTQDAATMRAKLTPPV